MAISHVDFSRRREVIRCVRAAAGLQLPQIRDICYNKASNSVMVPGLETAKFTFGSTVRVCAATYTCGALLRHALEQAPSGASIRAGLKERAAFLYPAQGGVPLIGARGETVR